MQDDVPNRSTDMRVGHRLVLVTGPSGAGRATAVNVLEDLGFEAIDNLPLSLIPRLLDGPPLGRPMALGIDVRNRDFSISGLSHLVDTLAGREDLDVELLYLDCSADVLLRRYSETRRRHPMAPAESPLQGIEREFDLLGPIRSRANILIDTSDLTPHELREELAAWFDADATQKLAVSVQSFSYKRGLPRGADLVFDCRFLRNPFWSEPLRELSGLDPAVAAYVAQDARFEEFFARLEAMAALLLPAFAEEGKAHLAIALGCTGGQHRSVAVAERLANALAASGWQVSIRHRELEKRAGGSAATGSKTGEQA